jgi:CRP-like cAMP-binding protein
MIEEFAAANKKLFKVLLGRAREFNCTDGRALYRQGDFPDGLFLIREGEASLLRLSPADRIIASFRAGPGCVLGLAAAVQVLPYTLSANVRRDTKVGFVDLVEFHSLLQDDPSLYPQLLSLLASDFRTACAAHQEAVTDTGRRRGMEEEACSEAHWEFLAAS